MVGVCVLFLPWELVTFPWTFRIVILDYILDIVNCMLHKS